MPELIERATAVPLDTLLAEIPTQGLSWHIEAEPGSMPRIAGIGGLATAGSFEISFLVKDSNSAQLDATQAGAVIVSGDVADRIRAAAPSFARVVCEHPYLLYARVAQWFAHRVAPRPVGVHPTAVIAGDVRLGEHVYIGPHVVIESGASIGEGSRIGAGSFIGAGCIVGAHALLHPRVTLYAGVRVGLRAILHSGAVLGADGFGFAPDVGGEPGQWAKIPQFGGVVLGDDVEVGANTTIDRGALDDTVIGNGVKLDNQIMIAHNVRVGDNTAMAACVGIAGSTTIGSRCTIGGAAMISGHLRLADDVHISGGTLVATSIDKPGRYTSVYPMAEHSEWQRNAAVVSQLARLRRRVQSLERDSS